MSHENLKEDVIHLAKYNYFGLDRQLKHNIHPKEKKNDQRLNQRNPYKNSISLAAKSSHGAKDFHIQLQIDKWRLKYRLWRLDGLKDIRSPYLKGRISWRGASNEFYICTCLLKCPTFSLALIDVVLEILYLANADWIECRVLCLSLIWSRYVLTILFSD